MRLTGTGVAADVVLGDGVTIGSTLGRYASAVATNNFAPQFAGMMPAAVPPVASKVMLYTMAGMAFDMVTGVQGAGLVGRMLVNGATVLVADALGGATAGQNSVAATTAAQATARPLSAEGV